MTLTVTKTIDFLGRFSWLPIAVSLFVSSMTLEAGLFSKKQTSCDDPCELEEEVCCEEERCPISGNGWSISGEYLYWSVWEEGLQLAGKGSLYPGNIQAIPFNWSNGFRAGLGGDFCDGWGLRAEYTYLRPKGSKTMYSNAQNNLYPFLIPDLTSGGLEWDPGGDLFTVAVVSDFAKARASVKMKYNMFDLEVRRVFCCLPHFDLILAGGAQGGLIKQTIQGTFVGNAVARYKGLLITRQQNIPITIDMSQQWRFGGGGLKIGLSGEYHHPCGFLFFTGGRFDVLFGQYRNSYDSQVTSIGVEQGFVDAFGNRTVVATPTLQGYYRFSGSEKFLDFAPNFQVDIGLGMEYLGRCWSARLNVGYEATYWFDLAQLRTGLSNSVDYIQPFAETTSIIFADAGETQRIASSVGLQGLVVSLEVKF